MAQENTSTDDKNNKAPAANSSNSMSSGSGSDLIGAGTIDKGKGVVKEEEEQEEGGGSKGKMMSTAQVVAGRAGGRRRGDGRALHIATERERRRRMSDMFSKLHGLLPSLPDKMDKSTIVMEAIHYIKTLERTLSELEKRKQDLARGIPGIGSSGNSGISSSSSAAMVAQQPPVGGILPTGAAAVPPAGAAVAAAPVDLQTWSGQHVVLSLLGNDAAYINVCSPRLEGRLTTVAAVLEKHGIEVITSGIASDSSRNMFTFHTRRVYNAPNSMFGNDVPTDDIYKLAVSEIMVWLSAVKEDERTSAQVS